MEANLELCILSFILKVKQLLHVLNLKYNIITKKLVHRLEFPDEHISETPGRVRLIFVWIFHQAHI